jgi:hypothetical protein
MPGCVGCFVPFVVLSSFARLASKIKRTLFIQISNFQISDRFIGASLIKLKMLKEI